MKQFVVQVWEMVESGTFLAQAGESEQDFEKEDHPVATGNGLTPGDALRAAVEDLEHNGSLKAVGP